MKWKLKKSMLQEDKPVDEVEYLTERKELKRPFEPWTLGLVHYVPNERTCVLKAEVYPCEYIRSICLIGDELHLYHDKDGLFAVDNNGMVFESEDMRGVSVHATEDRNSLKEEQ